MTNLDILINFATNASGALSQATSGLKNLNNTINTTGNRLGFMAFQWTFMAGIARRSLEEIRTMVEEVVNTGAAAQDSIVRAVATTIELQPGIKDTAKAADEVTTAIRNLGSGQTIFNVTQVSEAYQELASVTGNYRAALGLLQGTLRLMTITELDSASAARDVSYVYKDWGASVGDVNKMVNMLIQGSYGSGLSTDSFIRSVEQATPIAKQYGLTLAQTEVLLRSYAQATNIGITSLGAMTAAGGGLKTMLDDLMSATDSSRKNLGRWGVDLVYNRDGTKDFTSILDNLRKAYNNSSAAARQQLLEFIGGKAGIETWRALLSESTQDFNAQTDAINHAADAQKIYNMINNDAESSIKKVQSAVNTFEMAIVAGLAPSLNNMADTLNHLTSSQNIVEMFKEIGTVIGKVITPALQLAVALLSDFADLLNKNKAIIDVISVGFLSLVAILTMMLIIGTINALVSAMASLLSKTLTIAVLQTSMSFWELAAVLILILATVVFFQKAINSLIDFLNGKGDLTKTVFYSSLAILTGAFVTLLAGKWIAAFIGGIVGGFGTADAAAVAAGISSFMASAVGIALLALGAFLAGYAFGDKILAPFLKGLFGDKEDYATYSDSLKDSAFNAGTNLRNAVINGFIGNIADAAKQFAGWFMQVINDDASFYTELGKTIWFYLSQGLANFVSSFVKFADWFVKAIENEATQIEDAGKKLGEHLWNGLTSFFGGQSLWNLLKGLTGGGSSTQGNPFLPNAYGCCGGGMLQSNTTSTQQNQLTAQINTYLTQEIPLLQKFNAIITLVTATYGTLNITEFNKNAQEIAQTGAIMTLTSTYNTLNTAEISKIQSEILQTDLINQISDIYNNTFIPTEQQYILSIQTVTQDMQTVHTMLLQLESAIQAAISRVNATQIIQCCCGSYLVGFCGGPSGNCPGFGCSCGCFSLGGGGCGSGCGFATGGVVTARTHALIGEAGPEAVIPLAQLPSMLGVRPTTTHGPITINAPVNITVNNQNGNVDVKDLAQQVSDQIVSQIPKRLLLGRKS